MGLNHKDRPSDRAAASVVRMLMDPWTLERPSNLPLGSRTQLELDRFPRGNLCPVE